ncbi:Histone H2B [Purpureocillium lavendulum]|uniref:Histone H2B n=1 Tax=Purpureocillium lavendulum TaxID=1247861 RepID=A0AB34FPY6_9HYPO|nr:Histone H2B [Purpureocillium lavendulum]
MAFNQGILIASMLALTMSHSWVERLMVLNTDGTMIGTPGYPRGAVSRLDPNFNDFQMQHLLPSGLAPVIAPQDRICKSTQTVGNYTSTLPLLHAWPGAFIALQYQENGHVTLPNLTPQKKNIGQLYSLYWVWDWPSAPSNVLPDGKPEIYTTCIDIEIGTVPEGGQGRMNFLDGQDLNTAGLNLWSPCQRSHGPLPGGKVDEAVDLELELRMGEKLNNGRADVPRTAVLGSYLGILLLLPPPTYRAATAPMARHLTLYLLPTEIWLAVTRLISERDFRALISTNWTIRQRLTYHLYYQMPRDASLICAVEADSAWAVQTAITALHDRARVQGSCSYSFTALGLAAFRGHMHLVKILLERTAITPNWIAINAAREAGQNEIARYLLEKSGFSNAADSYGRTMLWTASNKGNYELVEFLLGVDCVDVTKADNHNHTPMFRAILNGHDKIVELFMRSGKCPPAT